MYRSLIRVCNYDAFFNKIKKLTYFYTGFNGSCGILLYKEGVDGNVILVMRCLLKCCL